MKYYDVVYSIVNKIVSRFINLLIFKGSYEIFVVTTFLFFGRIVFKWGFPKRFSSKKKIKYQVSSNRE